jgi:hypothetical protein
VEAVVVFALASVLLSYPLAFSPKSLSRLDNGDARLNAWAISWVAHQITEDPLRLFDANTFHPLPNSLAYSEHLSVLGIAALPLLHWTDNLVLTNNVLLLIAMFATAMSTYALVWSLTGSHLAAILAGLFFSFAPFRFNRLPHIQMQLYAFLPLTLLGLHRFVEERRSRWLVLMVCAFVLQVLSGTYLGAITAVALAVALVLLLPFSEPRGANALRVTGALTIAGIVLVPFVLPYLWVNRELGIEWGLEGLASLSATPLSYVASNSHLYRALSGFLVASDEARDFLFPGVALLALGGYGAFLALRDEKTRLIAVAYLAILAVGVVLSLGPTTPIYALLYEHIVFFRGLRALTRFGLLPLLSLSVLSGFALRSLFDNGGLRVKPRLAAVLIAGFFVAESTAAPYPLTRFVDDPPEVYPWLREQKPGPVVELPFKVVDTRYMFWARHHDFRKTLNGDSGFVPMSHQWIKVALNRFPSPDSIDVLRRLDVRYVVLHLEGFRQPALLRMLTRLEEYRHALVPVRDFGRDIVFEVVPPAPSARGSVNGEHSSDGPRQASYVESRAERTSSTTPLRGTPAALFDGDFEGVFRAPEPETNIEIDLGQVTAIRGLRLHYGPAPRVPAAFVSTRIESDSGNLIGTFSTPPDWPAVSELVTGLLATPKDGTQTILFPQTQGSRLRIQIRGMDGEPLELSEVSIVGAPEPGS